MARDAARRGPTSRHGPPADLFELLLGGSSGFSARVESRPLPPWMSPGEGMPPVVAHLLSSRSGGFLGDEDDDDDDEDYDPHERSAPMRMTMSSADFPLMS